MYIYTIYINRERENKSPATSGSPIPTETMIKTIGNIYLWFTNQWVKPFFMTSIFCNPKHRLWGIADQQDPLPSESCLWQSQNPDVTRIKEGHKSQAQWTKSTHRFAFDPENLKLTKLINRFEEIAHQKSMEDNQPKWCGNSTVECGKRGYEPALGSINSEI